MKKRKINILAGFFFLFIGREAFATTACIPEVPCDSSVTYAMMKQRQMLEDRMGDFDKTIRESRNETRKYELLLVKEGADLVRLRERQNIRLLKIMELSHLYKKARKEEESLSEAKIILRKQKRTN